jgi:hypothetical protein
MDDGRAKISSPGIFVSYALEIMIVNPSTADFALELLERSPSDLDQGYFIIL